MLYRGAFSVGNPAGGFFFNPFDFAVKGIANTSVLEFGGKLLALYEVWTYFAYMQCPMLLRQNFKDTRAYVYVRLKPGVILAAGLAV